MQSTDININEIIVPWTKQFDPNYNRVYYYNPSTNASIWELSMELKAKIEGAKK